MGNARPKPKRLAEKLRQIRHALGLSQTEMLKRLGADELISYQRISEYETGSREPSLMILLRYARIAGIYLEDLIDDELDLPAKLPSNIHYEGTRQKPTSRSKKR